MFLSNRVLWWPLKYLSRAYRFVSLCNFKYLSRMRIAIHDMVILAYFHFHIRRGRLPSIKWTILFWRLVSISHNNKRQSRICGQVINLIHIALRVEYDEKIVHGSAQTKPAWMNNIRHTKQLFTHESSSVKIDANRLSSICYITS